MLLFWLVIAQKCCTHLNLAITQSFSGPLGCNFSGELMRLLSIDCSWEIQASLSSDFDFWVCFGGKMGFVTMLAPKGLGPQNPTKTRPTGRTFSVNCYLENVLSQFSGLNPPPLSNESITINKRKESKDWTPMTVDTYNTPLDTFKPLSYHSIGDLV